MERHSRRIEGQCDRSGMKLGRVLGRSAAVDGVADNWAAQSSAMDAQLMRAPGAWAQIEPSPAVGDAEHPIIGDGALPARIDDHAPAAAAGPLLETGLDPALILGWPAFDHGPIDFFHLAGSKQRTEPAQRFWMPPEDEAAAGVAVEPVRKSGWMRHTEAQLIKVSLEVWAAARSAMHGNPGWLVDDQYEPVAIEHPSGQ